MLSLDLLGKKKPIITRLYCKIVTMFGMYCQKSFLPKTVKRKLVNKKVIVFMRKNSINT
jgi:hypothetical protein